jgi:hypothetical protein
VLGFYVDALSVWGSTLYCGGYFFSIDGAAREHIGAFDMNGGRLKDWNPAADGPILSLASTATDVFAAGQFQHIGGAHRNYVAAISAATGVAETWAPLVDDIVNVVLPRDSVVLLGGWFANVNSTPRGRLAAVDAINGEVMPWNPSSCGPVFSLAAYRDTVFAGGSFNVEGTCSDGVAALDERTGATAWVVQTDDQVKGLACDSLAVYAGGLFKHVGGRVRLALAALSRRTGDLLDWGEGCAGVVWALEELKGAVYAGGGFQSVGLEPRGNFVSLLPVACGAGGAFGGGACSGPTVVLLPQNPAGSDSVIRFTLPSSQIVSMAIYDVQGRVVAVPIRQELLGAGQQTILIHAGTWADGFYLCRLTTNDVSVTRKFLLLRR